MKVAIVGGKLQGTEAAFLAREAGWETVLVDRKPSPPAAKLCSSFCRCDIVKDASSLKRIIRQVDLIIPAVENVTALGALQRGAAEANVPLAYDADAYFISHSKKRSNRLFEKLGVPMPQGWPACELPLIGKPSASSGSQGVIRLDTQQELDAFLKRAGPDLNGWVLQEYLEGPSYSIEVMGLGGHYETFQVTEILVDSRYDCNQVLAPAQIPASLDRHIREIAVAIAMEIQLKGIMDVEVILNRGIPKVLEIDARLPSQTPTAVYESTGINMLELLRDIFVTGVMPRIPESKLPRGVVYEHVRASRRGLEFAGEHMMGQVASLEIVQDFFGADLGVTNFDPSSLPWVATLITTADTPRQAWLKRERAIGNIRRHLERSLGE